MTTSKKVLLVIFVLFSAINLIDFVFYGKSLRNLVGAAGFGLMARGCYANARVVSIVGAALALGSIIVKYVA